MMMMMNRFSSAAATVLVLVSLHAWSHFPLVVAAEECCLCDDCDMMMKPDATVYDLDGEDIIGCSDFAELVFFHVTASSDSCHTIQRIYQPACCMNANAHHHHDDDEQDNSNNNGNNNKNDSSIEADHRALTAPIPFSKRELWTSSGWTATTPRYTPSTTAWNFPAPTPTYWGGTNSNSQVVSTPSNTNGYALGCSVPTYNNAKYVSINTGYGSPLSVNCGQASRTGVPLASSHNMYGVAAKCLQCNCCGSCSGIDANVCVGNNQPRSNSGTPVGQWTANRNGWRNRLLEFLNM